MNTFRRKFWIWLFVLAPFWVKGEEVFLQKKKVLVLCSNGGGGHIAAANTLKALLEDRYDFTVIYPINELEIFGVPSAESLYNLALRKGWNRSVNIISRYVAPKVFRGYKKQLEKLIANHIHALEPDLVISVIPFINFPASEAARKADVPYLMITTDNDLQTFVHGLQGVSHPHFKVVVGTHLWCSQEMLHRRNISNNLIEVIGLPVRPDFLVKKDTKTLREKYRIPAHKPVILIMIGGAGGDMAYQYAKTLGQIQMGVHLIACAGRNEEMAADMRRIKLNPSNSITVMEFTDKIPELMSMADLIITKPGTLSTTESLMMRLPILMDCTNPVIDWEQANVDLIKKYGVGSDIKRLENAEMAIWEYLYDSELRHRIQQAYNKMPANRFNESIAGIIDEMAATKNLHL
ncbi:MAG TPA: glycosyltransferase [Rhabdochlamydiaceae bacterium]|jgi:processive 1,2-diacylglycerol beta-glucosyltransferase|nr:glycosyltransferase [Rhabdochlamydiaceae bacterium]